MKALGIISFENSQAKVGGLDDYRPVPAISFMGRYRIIDFILSNMTNSGIDNIHVYCKEKPRNLFAHLGSGQQYNINSKRGQLRILYGEKPFAAEVYNNDIANYMLNMQYIEEDSNPYVIVAPSYFIYSLDFTNVLQQHIESKSDITVLYTNTADAKSRFLECDTLTMDKDKRVRDIGHTRGKKTNVSLSFAAYVLRQDLFIRLVKKAAETSSLYWFRDILNDSLEEWNVTGYGIKGFVGCVNTLQEYFRISMELRDRSTAKGLFKPGWPVYTQTNDSAPTIYSEDSNVTGSVIANGCVIEGKVTDSVISRNVTIRKGAVIKNSIVLPGAYIGERAKLDHVSIR